MQGNVDIEQIKKRAISAFLSLTFRKLALQAITFASINLILVRIYPPETGLLGIFNLANSIIAFFAFFSDIGLAAALIQKKTDVTDEDLRTTFTIQQFLVGIITIVLLITAPFLANYYHLNQDGMWLIRSLALAFFLTSLKVIPSVMLERDLRFSPLVKVDILEAVAFNFILLILAFLGFGITSFTVAVLARSVTGVIAIYSIAPWRVGLALYKESITHLFSFGIPYQLNSLLALLKDRLVLLFVAKIVGTVGLSYITWAQAIAFLPLEIMTIVVRITFPAYSRLQNYTHELKKAVEKSIFLTTLLLYPALFGLLAVGPYLIKYLVSDKWLPALPLLYLFIFSNFWAAVSTIFTNALNAIGKIKITLKIMIFWTILTWILTPLFVIKFGYLGVAITSASISFTSVLPIIYFRSFVQVDVVESIRVPFLASAIMGFCVFITAKKFVVNIQTLIIEVILGIALYLLLIILFGRDRVLKEFKGVLSAFS